VIYGDESFVLVSWVIAILNSLFFCLLSHWESHDSSEVLIVLIQPDSPPAVSTECLQVACREFFLVSQTMEHTFYTNFSLMQICRNYRVILELQTKSCVDALLHFELTLTKYAYKITTEYNLFRASWTAKVTHIFL